MIKLGDPGNDFIREVKPHNRQNHFLEIPDSVFEGLYGGAAYGGKSFILTLLPLIRGFYKFRGFKGIILRRTFRDLELEVIRLSHDYYPLTGGVYNEQKHTWYWKEYGSYIDFGHMQHLGDVKRQYDSAQYNYCAYDELTHFEEAMYTYMIGSRVRPSSSFNVSIVRSGSNPGGIGQTFVYNRFVRPCEEGYKLIRDSKTGLSRIFIPAFYQDNPYGLEYDPRYGDKLEILPVAEKRAKKYGDWHAYEGSVFPEFRPIRFPNEPENALHIISSFTIPEWWPRILAIDWGKRAMCYAMWGAISPDGRVHIYRERAWIGKDIPEWAPEVRELSYSESLVECVLCGSAWQERGNETISQQFQRYSGIVASSSDNTPGSRIAGIQLIHDFLRWKPHSVIRSAEEFYDIEKANYIYRNYGDSALKKYQELFSDEKEETNLPKCLMFDNIKILAETIPVCVHDEKKTEDIAEFKGDDPIDCFRYFCKTVMKYLSGSGKELEKRMAIQNIIAQYEMEKDTTKFYRQMEAIESKQSESYGVSRRPRRRRYA